MMIQDEEDNYTLYSKTGTSDNPPIGWYVGFVKTKDHTYVFATNVDGQGSTSSQKAKQITVNILKEYKIIDTK